MQKARRHPTKGLRLVVGTRFQVLLTRLLSVLFIFPSRYWFTIGHGRVFSLTRWCWWIPTGFLRSRGTQEHCCATSLLLTGLSPSMVQLSRRFNFDWSSRCAGPTTPKNPETFRFGLFPVRSPLLRESLLLSLPPGT